MDKGLVLKHDQPSLEEALLHRRSCIRSLSPVVPCCRNDK